MNLMLKWIARIAIISAFLVHVFLGKSYVEVTSETQRHTDKHLASNL